MQEKPQGTSRLFIIEEKEKGKWIQVDRGKFDDPVHDLLEHQIDQIYDKYKENENFRLLIYNSFLSDFPDEVQNEWMKYYEHSIKMIEAKLDTSKKSGFEFSYTSNGSLLSQSTGLQFKQYIKEDTGTYSLICEDFHEIRMDAELLYVDSESLDEWMTAQLALEKAKIKLKKESRLQKNNPYDVVSSMWHKAEKLPTHESKSIYHFEFEGSDYHYIKWDLQPLEKEYSTFTNNGKELFLSQFTKEPLTYYEDISKWDPSSISVPINHYSLYLQNGSKRTIGVPHCHVFRDAFPSSFHEGSFWMDLNDLVVDPDFFVTMGLTKGHKIADFVRETKDYERDLNNIHFLLDCLYGDVHFLLSKTPIPEIGEILHLIEERMKTNSIWTCIK